MGARAGGRKTAKRPKARKPIPTWDKQHRPYYMRNLRNDLRERIRELAHARRERMEAVMNQAIEVGLTTLEAINGGRAA